MTITPPTRWTAVGDAVAAFLNAPTSTGIGAGVGFFALDGPGQWCDVAAYAMPAVPIAVLPGSATTILGAIKNAHPGNTTPTVPALQGAINYATSYAMSTPGHSAAVAFVTDGLPAGSIAEALECPHNTMSSHLAILARSGLVWGTRDGRSIIYRADLRRFREAMLFLLKDCCGGRPELCRPLIADLTPCCSVEATDND